MIVEFFIILNMLAIVKCMTTSFHTLSMLAIGQCMIAVVKISSRLVIAHGKIPVFCRHY